MPRLHAIPSLLAAALVLMLAAQAHAQDIPDRWMPEPPKPPKIPIPIREPIRPPVRAPVELKGYIYAVVVDPVDPMRMPGRTEYYFHAVNGQIYRLGLGRAKFYLCEPFIHYVGTGKLVVVKGYLVRDNGLLIAVEVRDPAYPHCR